MNTSRFTVRARYLFSSVGPPLRDGCLTIDDGRIVGVDRGESPHVIDLGQVAILPGLVNPHTHLEFSQLGEPLSRSGPDASFAEWIRRVIEWRSGQMGGAPTADWRRPAIQAGVHESLTAGVTSLGEIATLPVEPLDRYGGFSGVAFLELLGLADDAQDRLISAAQQFLKSFGSRDHRIAGLSPHAPYTVSPGLLERVVSLSSREQIPLAMHLAETREELELLETASGPLCDFLKQLGAWQAGAIPLSTKPLSYLKLLAKSHRALVIHGNYLDAAEIEWVAQRRDRMSLVYCPRTHAFFGHEPYPLAAMLEAGARVAIGTDSRASNPDLSLLNELRCVAARHAQIAPQTVLRMGTIHAAEALGLAATVGSLMRGKRADFVVVPIGEENVADPHELVLASDAGISAVFHGGVQVAGAPLQHEQS